MYRDKIFRLIGFNLADPTADFAIKAEKFLCPEGEWDTTDPEFNPDPPPQEDTWVDHNNPLSIWSAVRDGNISTAAMARFILDTGWDFIDHRNIAKPLEKPPEEVKRLLTDQIVDGKNFGDLSSATRGLLELVVKAFLYWYDGAVQ